MPSKTLLIMRHAKSSWAEEGTADHERPLNERGEKAAPRMGKWLRRQDLSPEVILCSSARRARQTADAVAAASGFSGDVTVCAGLYLAEPEAYVSLLRQLEVPAHTVLVIGHNPGLEELVFILTGEAERLPTAAVAVLKLPIATWSELRAAQSAELVNVYRPKELD